MLYQAFIAICLVNTPVQDCTRIQSLDWIAAPELQVGLSSCFKHGLEYAAESRLVRKGEYAKVFCTSIRKEPNVG